MKSKFGPGELIGHRKSGAPIYLMAGGSPEEDPTTETVATSPLGVAPVDPDNIFSNDAVRQAIAKARQDEKDKLYGRLLKQDDAVKALQTEVEALRKTREDQAAIEKAKADEVAAKQEAKRRDEVSTKTLLDETRAEFEAKIEALRQEQTQKDALFEKERTFLDLQAYTQARVGAEADNIAPELLDLVNGSTREEVDASIELLKAKTQAIFESVQAAQVAARQQQRGVSPTGYALSGPMDNEPNYQSISAADLKNMPMNKYAELRAKLGIGGETQRNRGLFG